MLSLKWQKREKVFLPEIGVIIPHSYAALIGLNTVVFCKKQFNLPSTYCVYVIELSKKVFTEDARFRAANPQFNGVLECVYVGMTSKTPQERLKQHKTGYRNKRGHKLSANIVEKYGRYLRPSLYEHLDKLTTRQEALLAEEKLAWELRRKGYAVWFN